jgi:hypothetical protein
MRGPKLWIALAAAAIAVGIQNYVFFSSQSDPPRARSQHRNAERDEAPQRSEALEPIDSAALARWMETLPTPGRSPFLTRDESDALGGPVGTTLPSLDGTLWSRHRRVAWIGGQPHSEGDWVGVHRLERIEPSGVVLRQGANRLHLRARSDVGEPNEDPINEK